MFIQTLVFLFLLRLRFAHAISSSIYDRYGVRALRSFRYVEKQTNKVHKLEHDVKFLKTCKAYEVVPKFIRIRAHRKDFQIRPEHHAYELTLLDQEIKVKINHLSKQKHELELCIVQLKSLVSSLDFGCLSLAIRRKQTIRDAKTAQVHENKLYKLGIQSLKQRLNPSKIITNLSHRKLSRDEEKLLLLGLEFGIPINKLDYKTYFLKYEILLKKLKQQPICYLLTRDKSFKRMRDQVRQVANSFYYGYKSPENPLFSKNDYNILKNLASDPTIKVTSPDKGQGVVIMNTQDYRMKLEDILGDTSKFQEVERDEDALLRSLQDKLNNFLRDLKKQDKISEQDYLRCYTSGTSLGAMYGLAKTHKPDIPLRPIVSAYNTPNYNIGKFVLPMISHLSTNQYVLRNSYEFTHQIGELQGASDAHMCSFDIKSLYTNVPVSETIDIIMEKIFTQDVKTHFGFTCKEFKKLLEMALKDSFF